MPNENYETILNLKEEVNKLAPPRNHASGENEYGIGTENQYGHVKLEDTLHESENPVKGSAIISYINNISNYPLNIETNSLTNSNQTNNKYNIPTSKAILDKISDLTTQIPDTIQEKINIIKETEITNESTDDKIPTSKAVYDIVSNSLNSNNIDLSQPIQYQGEIDGLIVPGYYIMNHNIEQPKTFNYGGESICYTNALVTVKQQSNRIIQNVSTTSKVISSSDNNQYTYKINGSEYTRYGIYESVEHTTWKSWHLLHKPYTKVSRVNELGTNIDENGIEVYENTSGFIIKWAQTNSNQNRYVVSAPLYSYTDICTFHPTLPISGPYVFSNLIGRMDVKITPEKMQIRSNISPGGYIANIDETYFVPRNQ